MFTLSPCLSAISDFVGFISWKDPVEIIFFSIFIYSFSVWLKADTAKPLLSFFYTFCSILLAAWFFNFPTIYSFLLLYSPLLLILMVMIHQELLQRNFVALKKIVPAQQEKKDNWLEVLLRICLRTKNNNKSTIVIIEQTDALHMFIDAPFMLETPLQEPLLTLLVESPSYDEKKMIWANKDGMLLAVNVSWKQSIDKTWYVQELEEKDPPITNALMITGKTDALMIICNAHTGTFDIIAQGKLVEQVWPANALRILRHYLQYAPQPHKKGDKAHEILHTNKKSSTDQPQH